MAYRLRNQAPISRDSGALRFGGENASSLD
jgi:hypothetical protein